MFIYSITNMSNGKIYIGATRRSITKRTIEHKCRSSLLNTPLHKAIREYGWESFKSRILEKCSNIACLYEAEKKWISHFNSTNHDYGYNLTLGGVGSPGYEFTSSARKKISDIHKGHKHSIEFIEKRIAPQRGQKRPLTSKKLSGRVLSEETKKKIGLAGRGRKVIFSQKALKNFAIAAKKRSTEGIGAKLSPSKSLEILSRRNSGESFALIAKDYDVTPSAIFYFCKRQLTLGGGHP